MEEMIGGSKGEETQYALWETLLDRITKVLAEAENLGVKNNLLDRGQEIVDLVKSRRFVLLRPWVPIFLVKKQLFYRECLKVLEEAIKSSNKEALTLAIQKAQGLSLGGQLEF